MNKDNNQNDNLDLIKEENEEKELDGMFVEEEIKDPSQLIYELDIRLQEIDVILEKYEDTLFETNQEILSVEEVKALKAEAKEIRLKKKTLLRKGKETVWDQFPLWMAFYAIFQFIFSFYYVLIRVSIYYLSWAYKFFYNIIKPSTFMEYVYILTIPLLSLILSLVILLLIKNKTNKKIFGIIYAIQGVETIGAIIFMVVRLLKV